MCKYRAANDGFTYEYEYKTDRRLSRAGLEARAARSEETMGDLAEKDIYSFRVHHTRDSETSRRQRDSQLVLCVIHECAVT